MLGFAGCDQCKPLSGIKYHKNGYCKTGPDSYKKHYLGLPDNVTYFVEQIDPAREDPFHYKVTFKPSSIVPDIKLNTKDDNDGADQSYHESEGSGSTAKSDETSAPTPSKTTSSK